jgi:uncharacterized protein YjiS (DUF1127 family)
MNPGIAKEEIALLFPNSLTFDRFARQGGDQSARVAAEQERREAPHRGLLASLSAAVAWVVELPRRHAVLNELSALSDRELADIGLSRDQLGRVFEPEFAAARSAGRSAN